MLKEDNNTLQNEKEVYKAKLEEFITLKEKYDKKTMSNFVLILNEKKKRIQYLNDLLDAFRNGREPTNPKPSAKVNFKSKTVEDVEKEEGTSKKQRLETISDSESDNYNTDEEESTKAVVENEPMPSTSKEYINILAEDDSPPERMIIEEVESNKVHEPTNMQEAHFSDTKIDENIENENSKASETITDAESPTLEFSTQDLLDRL